MEQRHVESCSTLAVGESSLSLSKQAQDPHTLPSYVATRIQAFAIVPSPNPIQTI